MKVDFAEVFRAQAERLKINGDQVRLKATVLQAFRAITVPGVVWKTMSHREVK